MPPTVGSVQYSTPLYTYVAEDQLRCPTLLQLSKSAVLPCPLSPYKRIWYPRELVHVTHKFVYVHMSVNWQFDIPERDRHVRTYVCTYVCTYVRTHIARIHPSFKAARWCAWQLLCKVFASALVHCVVGQLGFPFMTEKAVTILAYKSAQHSNLKC